MRKKLIAVGVTLGALTLLTGAGLFYIRSGPTGPVPAQDPILTANADHADIEDNAADHYRVAMDVLTGQPPVDRSIDGCRELTELTPELRTWVADNEAVLLHLRAAAECQQCWFDLRRDQNGMVEMGRMSPMRLLARYLAFRARIVAEGRDLAAFTENLQLLDTMARHIMQSPYLIDQLIGIASLALTQSLITLPLTWEDLDAADRQRYIAAVTPLCTPPPSLEPALRFDRDLSVWMYIDTPQSAGGPAMHVVAPPERLAGEIDRVMDLTIGLATAPLVDRFDPESPSRAALASIETEMSDPSIFNIPRMLASILLPSLERAGLIQGGAITQQRGNRTVLALFAHRDRHGAFPESLDALDADYTIDPFSRAPFVYRVTDDGFTLYSVGTDREDDGGMHDKRFGEARDDDPADGDFVFWPRPE